MIGRNGQSEVSRWGDSDARIGADAFALGVDTPYIKCQSLNVLQVHDGNKNG